ncbi:MAG: ERCC4 domain-containing protein, partial [Desulfosalsimonas sp.]|uniref:ERCC4 domain-containing protein n=1 Tax=Desulfosalsimonas sp. TaxID=3073848 RepID=UPI00397089BB
MGDIAGMIIIIDTREQAPYEFTDYDVAVVRSTLPCGDYSIPGAEHLVSIERKMLDDLISCLMGKNRDRFERELGRLRSYHVAAVVVEAGWQDISRGRYTSNMKPQSALQSVIAMQVRGQGFVYFFWRNKRFRLFAWLWPSADCQVQIE